MKDSCADLENAPASVRGPMDTAQAALEDKKMEFDEHFLVLAEITPTTRADVETLDMAELQEAIVASIAHLQGAEDMEREAVIVNVFSAAADPYWADVMPAPKRNLAATEAFSKMHNFKVCVHVDVCVHVRWGVASPHSDLRIPLPLHAHDDSL